MIIRGPILPWELGAEKGRPVAAYYGYLPFSCFLFILFTPFLFVMWCKPLDHHFHFGYFWKDANALVQLTFGY